jgi:predicted transposase YbfD/YdcC
MRQDIRLVNHFNAITDPRRQHLQRHKLLDIIVIAICGVIADCDDWQEIEVFAKERQDWLASFLDLPNGIPSHDTLERVFDRIDPAEFNRCFLSWTAQLLGAGISHVAIDGKTLRGTRATGSLHKLHLVSAWACKEKLSLAQVAVETESNEITAIPKLLKLLEQKGAMVSIDAMGTQKEIASQIKQAGADYVLVVKENHPKLLEDIQTKLNSAFEEQTKQPPGYTWHTSEETGHGRREKRTVIVLSDLAGIEQVAEWEGISVIGMVVNERQVGNGKWSEEVRYFIGSRKGSAKEYGQWLRGHWGIENRLHWQLDVTFGEDANQVQNRHAAENLALLRKFAINVLRQSDVKLSTKCKRLKAALSTSYLDELLIPLKQAICNA